MNIEPHVRELLDCALKAPSTHNIQPWKFRVDGLLIELCADFDRQLKVSDPDAREIYVSLGCALENLIIAAENAGRSPSVILFPTPGDDVTVARVVLDSGEPNSRDPRLLDAIDRRATNHDNFDGKPISPENLDRLTRVVNDPDVRLLLSSDDQVKDKIEELIARAEAAQFADIDFREELGRWLSEGAGMSWLMGKIARFSVLHMNMGPKITEKEVEHVHCAPVLGLVATRHGTRTDQVRAGQAFQRVWLECTLLGIEFQPMNAILEVAETRDELRQLLPEPGLEPQVAFRIGYGKPAHPHTRRRPLEEVLIDA